MKAQHCALKQLSLSLSPHDTMDMDGMVQAQVKYIDKKTPKSYKHVFD